MKKFFWSSCAQHISSWHFQNPHYYECPMRWHKCIFFWTDYTFWLNFFEKLIFLFNIIGKGGYEIPLLHNVHNANSNLLSNISPGPIEIHCSKSSYLGKEIVILILISITTRKRKCIYIFSAHDVYHHKMSLIPDLVVNKVFALVALIVTDEKVEGKIILQPKCVDSDLSKQMKNLFSVLNMVSIQWLGYLKASLAYCNQNFNF